MKYELEMAFQARDQHVQNYRNIKKKKKKNAKHGFPMKILLDSPVEEEVLMSLRIQSPCTTMELVYKMIRCLKKKV